MKRQKISWDAIYIMAWLNWDLKPMARAISKWPGDKILGYPRQYHIVALYIRLSRLAIVFDSIKLFPSHLSAIILGVSSIQKTYLTRLTCPRPFLFLPWLRLLTVMIQLFSVICDDAKRSLWVLCFISLLCCVVSWYVGFLGAKYFLTQHIFMISSLNKDQHDQFHKSNNWTCWIDCWFLVGWWMGSSSKRKRSVPFVVMLVKVVMVIEMLNSQFFVVTR